MAVTKKWTTLVVFVVASVFQHSQLTMLSAQDEDITPDSEYVKAMVKPAVAYLKANYNNSREYGNSALVGLAIFNAGLRFGIGRNELKRDPVLSQILDKVSEEIGTITPEGERTIYAACVSGLLLAEVDEVKYSQQIKKVLEFLYARQQPHGGWGYKKEPAGDTSQTQYASLFFWLAKEKRFNVKKSAVEGAINFLINTQHASGGFVYKAQPGQIFGNTTQSLTAAGLGSIYLLGDAYGLHGGQNVSSKKRKPAEQLLPVDVTLVVEEDPEEKKQAQGPARQINGFGACKSRGDQWFQNNFTIDPAAWTYYYLYGYERYRTFKERADKQDGGDSPRWYVLGAKFLKSKQNGNGSWISSNSVEQSYDHSTSFAILFLVRSTKLIVPSWTSVFEAGGAGLPEEGELTMRGGRLVNKTFRQDFDKVLALVETGTDTDWSKFASKFDQLVLDSKGGSRAQQLATLRNLVTHENPVARRIAVQSIGKVRDFNNIPFLIFALTDPQPEIVGIANDGLRFVSRKFNARKVSSKPSKDEMNALVKFWSKWYLEVVPEGRLLEVE
jgi:hypothetical protein